MVVVIFTEPSLSSTSIFSTSEVTIGGCIVRCEKVSCLSLALTRSVAFNSKVSLVESLFSHVHLMRIWLLVTDYTVFLLVYVRQVFISDYCFDVIDDSLVTRLKPTSVRQQLCLVASRSV